VKIRMEKQLRLPKRFYSTKLYRSLQTKNNHWKQL